MSDFDPDRLLEPVSDKDPSGEDLSDTLDFRSVQGRCRTQPAGRQSRLWESV